MLVHPSPSLSLSLVCFFFETVRTFLVRKVGDGMPFVTDVGEKKKFEIVAFVLWFVCRMSSQVCHCL